MHNADQLFKPQDLRLGLSGPVVAYRNMQRHIQRHNNVQFNKCDASQKLCLVCRQTAGACHYADPPALQQRCVSHHAPVTTSANNE